MSSRSSRFTFWYRSRNRCTLSNRIEVMNSCIKWSEVTYRTIALGSFFFASFPMACNRWVFPSPVPPYMNSGLYTVPRPWHTAYAAAWAREFDGPTMNELN